MKYALTLAVMALSFTGGWRRVRAIQAQRDLMQIQAHHAQKLAAAQQRARQREQHLQQKIEVLQHETQQQLAEISAIERAAADSRVRELVQHYAAGSKRSDSTSAARCAAERAPATVLAELLTELDALAGQFAATADRNRISGLACEKAYQAVQLP